MALLLTCVACKSDDDTQTFLPVFEGLSSGNLNKKNGCISIEKKSVQLSLKEFSQELKVFKLADCDEKDLSFSQEVSIETQVVGIWNDYLVLDEGTDVNSREVHLININNKAEKYRFNYALQITFKPAFFIFFQPLEQEANAALCAKEQTKEIKEWSKFGFALGLSREMIFDIKKKTSVTGEKKLCYPIQ